MVDMVTAKVVFASKTTTEVEAMEMLNRYTTDYTIHNFYTEMQVGCNKLTFAVVDMPRSIITPLLNDKFIKDVEVLTHFNGVRSSKKHCSASAHS